jgi:hypothetical protein
MVRLAKSFNKTWMDAYNQLKIPYGRREEFEFKRYEKSDFDALKKAYTDKYGYVIKIPEVSDIVHLVPNEMKTLQEIKDAKREGLTNILASPAPNWARKYSTIMTYLDNIQDTSSIVFPAFQMLWRTFPKVFGKALPFMGWLMLGFDLLNVVIGVGRAPMTGMASKRMVCSYFKTNPFGKKAQWERKERIKTHKPGFGDALQVLQVTDQFTGVGLSLGALMGFIQDSAFGAYRYLNGDRVRWSTELPQPNLYELGAAKAMQSAAVISSAGQTFSELQHFWTYAIGLISPMIYGPYANSCDFLDTVETPMQMVIPAPSPTDPLTIEVIKEAGLNVNDGVGWPFTGEKEMSLDELTDHIALNSREVFRDYLFRHDKDWYGYVVASLFDMALPFIVEGIDPTGSEHYEDTPISQVMYRLLKYPLLPLPGTTKEQWATFESWVNDYHEFYGKAPGISEIKNKFENLRIPFKESYPTVMEDEGKNLWPDGFDGAEFL